MSFPIVSARNAVRNHNTASVRTARTVQTRRFLETITSSGFAGQRSTTVCASFLSPISKSRNIQIVRETYSTISYSPISGREALPASRAPTRSCRLFIRGHMKKAVVYSSLRYQRKPSPRNNTGSRKLSRFVRTLPSAVSP